MQNRCIGPCRNAHGGDRHCPSESRRSLKHRPLHHCPLCSRHRCKRPHRGAQSRSRCSCLIHRRLRSHPRAARLLRSGFETTPYFVELFQRLPPWSLDDPSRSPAQIQGLPTSSGRGAARCTARRRSCRRGCYSRKRCRSRPRRSPRRPPPDVQLALRFFSTRLGVGFTTAWQVG